MTKKTTSTSTGHSIPQYLEIGPFVFRVIVGEDDSIIMDDYGSVSFDEEVIHIRSGLSVNTKKETLLHEILHCLFYISGKNGGPFEEESIISGISPLLFDTIKRNPLLKEYLFD